LGAPNSGKATTLTGAKPWPTLAWRACQPLAVGRDVQCGDRFPRRHRDRQGEDLSDDARSRESFEESAEILRAYSTNQSAATACTPSSRRRRGPMTPAM